jgi:DNA-binding transcriptional LysR family regulator
MASDELDWDDLRYFLAAARHQSLVAAARALSVEHTTVGRRVQALERALGVPLVLRGPEGITLTRHGARIVERVEELERAVRALRETLRSEAACVRLAVPSGFTQFFTQHLTDLTRAHPTLSLEILSGAQPVDLSRGEADLALRTGKIEDKELVARKLCETGFSLYGSRAYLARHARPFDVDDLRGHTIIAFHERLAASPASRWLAQRANGATYALRSRELADMVTATLDGVGLAVLPCCLADGEPRLERLTTEVVASVPLYLVQRRETRVSEELRIVARFVTATVAANGARFAGTAA